MATATVMRVPLELVISEPDLQTRQKPDPAYTRELQTWLEEHPGEDMDPVECILVDGEYAIYNGFHRRDAYEDARRDTIPVLFKVGTMREAKLLAAGANVKHGLRRTHDDKKKAVRILLNDLEWSQWSDRAIAEACGVSHNFVSENRRHLSSDDNGESSPRERVTRSDGRTMKNPAHTKLTLRVAPEGEEADTWDDDEEGGDDDPRADADVVLVAGDNWHAEAVRLLAPWRECRGPLDIIKGALLDLHKAVARSAS